MANISTQSRATEQVVKVEVGGGKIVEVPLRTVNKIREFYDENVEICSHLAMRVMNIWDFEGISTSICRHRKRQLQAAYFEYLYSLGEEEAVNTEEIAKKKAVLEGEIRHTNALKEVNSLLRKYLITGQELHTFKDPFRSTTIFEQKVESYKDLEKTIDVALARGLKWGIYLEDYKVKVKPNGYSDISLYFGCYTMGKDGKTLYRKRLETQLQSEKVLNVKKEETVLYDEIKNICTDINRILKNINLDTDEVYLVMRVMLDIGLLKEDGSIENNQENEFEEIVFDFLVNNKTVEKDQLGLTRPALLKKFVEARKIFCKSFVLYKDTEPVLDRQSQKEIAQFLDKRVKRHRKMIAEVLHLSPAPEMNQEALDQLYEYYMV